MANPLTLTRAGFDTTGFKFGTAALSAGNASTAGAILPAGGFTAEAWIKSAGTSGVKVAFGSSPAFWVGANAGTLMASIGQGGSAVTLTGPALGAGWRHVALVCGSGGSTLFLDGAAVATSATPFASTGGTLGAAFGIANFEANGAGNGTVFEWVGSIDEAAIWSGARYTGTFSPPSGAYTGGESGLLALWHLDSTGADSAGTVSPPSTLTIFPDDSGILYSPYTWQVTHGAATAWNPGAYFRTLFSGPSCTMTFDVTNNGSPLSQLWWRVDHGPWTQAAVASSVVCSIPVATAGNADVPFHRLEVVFKSIDSANGGLNRWNSPSATALRFTGLVLASGSTVSLPARAPLNILIYGDSLTEGVRTLGEAVSTTPDNNDAMFCWAFELGRQLGAEVGVVGWGGTGFSASFGNVPVFGSSYALLAAGVARSFTPSPDLVIINHGANDGGDITAAAKATINALLSVCSKAQIAVLNPLPRPDNTYLRGAAAGISVPARVRYISSAGFFSTALGADGVGLHPSGPNSAGVIAPKVAAAVKSLLPVPPRWTH